MAKSIIQLAESCKIAERDCVVHCKFVSVLISFSLIFVFTLLPVCLSAQSAPAAATAKVLTIEGTVEVLSVGSTNWQKAKVEQILQAGDQVGAGSRSRATVRLSSLCVIRVSELTSYEILPPRRPGTKPVINVKAGSAYFFSRDQPEEIQLQTPVVTGAIRGTEFNVTVAADGRTEVTLLNGEVELFNTAGSVMLKSGEQGIAEAGRAPFKTAVINAINIIQWNLYYPAVLDVGELGLSDVEEQSLSESLAAYRAGDLPEALEKYPAPPSQDSDAQKIYFAELLLSVGLVDQSEAQLNSLKNVTPHAARLAGALRQLVRAVKFVAAEPSQPPELASEWLAQSYVEQSHSKLDAALASAYRAVEKSPSFSFGWERVAELEFSFGRTEKARVALDKSLQLAPRNAQAHALKGFLLSAENRLDQARSEFEDAIRLDSSLDNAWLGRGLVKIRSGDAAGGVQDLQVGAVLAPNRSLLHSYLGKAFSNAGENIKAALEFKRAVGIDPNDPTPWLYSALLKREQNQINNAVAELQKAIDLNMNRAVYRSRFLLDEDRAVAHANLASIYRDAGMTDVSLREAASAVNDDYANASAHLFLSDAYNDLRDPTQFNLRYETVWFNELLLANLLSPVGGGRLSQEVSQHEYSKLFQQDGANFASSTEARSDGMYHERASQFGTFGNTAYALDLDYHHNEGVRPNNGLDDIEWNTTIKRQITPQDTALLLVQYQDYHSGDNFQYYYQTNARPFFKFDEYQHPILVGGWDHEWSPGIRTLALLGRLTDEQYFSDKAAPQLVLGEDSGGTIYGTSSEPYDVKYHNKFTIYSGELNQICQWDRISLSAGVRYQSGSFQSHDKMGNTPLPVLFGPTTNSESDHFERITGYGYLTVEPLERLWLTGGFAYDDVTFPDNYRQPPVASGESERSQLGPKAALVWNPIPQATLRGAYSRSLGGVSLDESYRLEPTQLAGFPQAFRSLISESLVGSVAAPTYETLGVALDLKLGPRTFAGIQAERLTTDVARTIGNFVLQNGVSPGATPEKLNYEEYALSASLNQLVGDYVVIGTAYRMTRSRLHDVLSAVPAAVLERTWQQSTLQQADTYIQFNHPSGFFTRAEAHWYGQSNSGWTPAEPGDHFFQCNLFAGYYFANRRANLQLGILNLAGGNYHLNPLTPYQELPRSRVVEGTVNFLF